MEIFTFTLTEAAREAIPPYRGGKNLPRGPWFLEECKQAIMYRKRAQRKYFRNPFPSNFISFTKLNAKCKFTIRQAWVSSISNPPSSELLENSSSNMKHHLALWENPFFVKGGDCGAKPKTKQRPFRPNH